MGKKRALDAQRDADMIAVGRLLARGYTQQQVLEELNRDGSRAVPITRHRVSKLVEALRQNHRLVAARLWQSQLDETLAELEAEIERLNAVEEECWAAWRRSGQAVREARLVEVTTPALDPDDPDGPPLQRVARQTRHSISRDRIPDPRFMLVVLETVRRRAELRRESLELRGWRQSAVAEPKLPPGVDVEAVLAGDRRQMAKILGHDLMKLYSAEERATSWAVVQADPAERVRFERLAEEARGKRIRLVSAGLAASPDEPLGSDEALVVEVVERALPPKGGASS